MSLTKDLARSAMIELKTLAQIIRDLFELSAEKGFDEFRPWGE